MRRPNLATLIKLFNEAYDPELKHSVIHQTISTTTRYAKPQDRIADKLLGREFLSAVQETLDQSKGIRNLSVIVHHGLPHRHQHLQALKEAGYDMREIVGVGPRSRLHGLEIQFSNEHGRQVHVLMDIGGIGGVALGRSEDPGHGDEVEWQSVSHTTVSSGEDFNAKKMR